MIQLTLGRWLIGRSSNKCDSHIYSFVPQIVAFCLSVWLLGNQSLAADKTQSTASLTETVKSVDNGQTELHIFYVHGMGIGPVKHSKTKQDFETSAEFRAGFCKKRFLNCSNDVDHQFQNREYAHTGLFDPSAASPDIWFFDQQIWKTKDETGPIKKDWYAATPFVDHFELRRKNGTVVHLHEINWWPLVMSAKCREIVAQEALLIGKDKDKIKVCSVATQGDGDDRYRTYQWIPDAAEQTGHSPASAPINRGIKAAILDWGFADALLALGPIKLYLLRGIQELIEDTYSDAARGSQGKKLEFIFITHSLGSYLTFFALDVNEQNDGKPHPWKDSINQLMCHTSHAYFMANQIRLLELANLDREVNGNVINHLKTWAEQRALCHESPPKFDAFNDPSDWLTWQVPEAGEVHVLNHPVVNSPHWPWLWLFEYPPAAHLNYDKNKHVLGAMLPTDTSSQKP